MYLRFPPPPPKFHFDVLLRVFPPYYWLSLYSSSIVRLSEHGWTDSELDQVTDNIRWRLNKMKHKEEKDSVSDDAAAVCQDDDGPCDEELQEQREASEASSSSSSSSPPSSSSHLKTKSGGGGRARKKQTTEDKKDKKEKKQCGRHSYRCICESFFGTASFVFQWQLVPAPSLIRSKRTNVPALSDELQRL